MWSLHATVLTSHLSVVRITVLKNKNNMLLGFILYNFHSHLILTSEIIYLKCKSELRRVWIKKYYSNCQRHFKEKSVAWDYYLACKFRHLNRPISYNSLFLIFDSHIYKIVTSSNHLYRYNTYISLLRHIFTLQL